MKIIDKVKSKDGKSTKYLQMTSDNVVTETAYINDTDRHIICHASQLGCPIACTMCYNGVQRNYKRNLTKQEIIGECYNVIEDLNLVNSGKPILFSCMGIGEPLLNYDNVVHAFLELNKKYPNNRFALATTGINSELIPKFVENLEVLPFFKLTISLHGSNDELRKQLIPIHTSLVELKNAVNEYKRKTKHLCEWNYVLLEDINDSEENAKELVDFLDKDDNVKLSVFNEVDSCSLKFSKNFGLFEQVLKNNDISCKLFNSEGKDVGAGCGQMVTRYLKKTPK